MTYPKTYYMVDTREPEFFKPWVVLGVNQDKTVNTDQHRRHCLLTTLLSNGFETPDEAQRQAIKNVFSLIGKPIEDKQDVANAERLAEIKFPELLI